MDGAVRWSGLDGRNGFVAVAAPAPVSAAGAADAADAAAAAAAAHGVVAAAAAAAAVVVVVVVVVGGAAAAVVVDKVEAAHQRETGQHLGEDLVVGWEEPILFFSYDFSYEMALADEAPPFAF